MPHFQFAVPGFGRWWSVSQRGVWPDGVEVQAPAFSQHAQFLDRVEDFAIEELISQLAVERFAVAVLPRRSGFDVECLRAGVDQPLTQVFGYELRPIV